MHNGFSSCAVLFILSHRAPLQSQKLDHISADGSMYEDLSLVMLYWCCPWRRLENSHPSIKSVQSLSDY